MPRESERKRAKRKEREHHERERERERQRRAEEHERRHQREEREMERRARRERERHRSDQEKGRSHKRGDTKDKERRTSWRLSAEARKGAQGWEFNVQGEIQGEARTENTQWNEPEWNTGGRAPAPEEPVSPGAAPQPYQMFPEGVPRAFAAAPNPFDYYQPDSLVYPQEEAPPVQDAEPRRHREHRHRRREKSRARHPERSRRDHSKDRAREKQWERSSKRKEKTKSSLFDIFRSKITKEAEKKHRSKKIYSSDRYTSTFQYDADGRPRRVASRSEKEKDRPRKGEKSTKHARPAEEPIRAPPPQHPAGAQGQQAPNPWPSYVDYDPETEILVQEEATSSSGSSSSSSSRSESFDPSYEGYGGYDPSGPGGNGGGYGGGEGGYEGGYYQSGDHGYGQPGGYYQEYDSRGYTHEYQGYSQRAGTGQAGAPQDSHSRPQGESSRGGKVSTYQRRQKTKYALSSGSDQTEKASETKARLVKRFELADSTTAKARVQVPRGKTVEAAMRLPLSPPTSPSEGMRRRPLHVPSKGPRKADKEVPPHKFTDPNRRPRVPSSPLFNVSNEELGPWDSISARPFRGFESEIPGYAVPVIKQQQPESIWHPVQPGTASRVYARDERTARRAAQVWA